jgi:hypothetical protein
MLLAKIVSTVWIIWRNNPNGSKSIWAIGDDEYSAKKIAETLMNKEEFVIFPCEVTHVETER